MYKLKGLRLIEAPYIAINAAGNYITGYNKQSKEKLIADGWKPLTKEPVPEVDKTQRIITRYRETDTEIIEYYEVVENEED